ncbi:hypothetical protein [Candidatus Bathycorpusculum sp.]|jgi:hypothetical protein|uniref:hypothetical protein n=1 Tax=Candidatus Bathycorpusculum sp. TaxID=2994959 RepID=UPI0028284DA5|nr:hypothetical protein [Candidatus Termitimicrobium sp.]MCL2684947.1 hypothetical protein [Candidatus Termitimicrobium sp.]
MSRVWIICKKIFSLTLIFNALLTIACAVSILSSVYWIYPGWKPFSPYLVDGYVFWVVIVAAVLNVFPSALLGRKLHTGRFLFHHYVYGFLVLAVGTIYVTFFTPVSVATIFLVNNTVASVNAGRFLLLGGLTLLLDDLPDVSKHIETALNHMKAGAFRIRKLIIAAQLGTGVISLYLFVAVCVAMIQVPEWVTLANFILILTTFITSVCSFIFVKRKVWDSIMIKQENTH